MSLRVERNYVSGVPQSSVSGFAPRGLVWHWTAGGTGRAGAESTIRHFVNTRYTVNASYHVLLFREGSATVAMWIVPVTRASHSMNPGLAFRAKTGSARERARFTEVRRILARDSDPNADTISVSFCGMPADLAAAMRDPGFRADVRQLAAQLENHPTVTARPHFGHGWIQPATRYETDAAPGGADLLIDTVLYDTSPQEETDDMFPMRSTYEPWKFDPGAKIYAEPRTDAPVLFTFGSGGGAGVSVAEQATYGADGTVVATGVWRQVLMDNDPLKRRLGWVHRNDMTVVTEGMPEFNELMHKILWGTDLAAVPSWPPKTETVTETVEVVKEVPTGITEGDVTNAVKAERERIAQAEANRIRET